VAPRAALKIGIAVAQAAIPFELVATGQAGEVTLHPGRVYRVRREGTHLLLAEGNTELLRADTITVTSTGAAGLQSNGRRYRGTFAFIAAPETTGQSTLINLVAPEEYLYGVVPAEMASGWPEEALKAQAVAARTYAIANVGRRAALGFDLFDTVSDQVYRGFSAERADTSAAVDATRGQMLTWQDRPIAAFLHASSGGETDDAVAVWGQDLPYIRGVRDLDPSPHADWTASFDDSELQRALIAMGQDVGPVEDLAVTRWTPHGRARFLRAKGPRGQATLDGNTFRLRIGLKSTRYRLSRPGRQFRFDGGGWGHGLGMSQWGARAYATQGESYRGILERYYFQTTLGQTSR
jgi:stage II sporulation protein D